jgi:hypothetical protein
MILVMELSKEHLVYRHSDENFDITQFKSKFCLRFYPPFADERDHVMLRV